MLCFGSPLVQIADYAILLAALVWQKVAWVD